MQSLPEHQRTLKLFIVSTPIGNLKDISIRAIEVLQSADYILCEDTRRAQKLRTSYSLKTKLVSFHEYNEKQRIPKIIELMKAGKTFALISDAGSPLISDPGALLVKQMINEGLDFTFIPGPSSVIAALVLSGMPVERFTFAGFLPNSRSRRSRTLRELAAMNDQTIVLFESPQRLLGLIREIGEIFGNRNLAICRELTKLHEEVLRGSVQNLLQELSQRKLLGEFTVVIASGSEDKLTMTDESIRARFQQLLKEGLSRKDALKKVGLESGRSRNDLYNLLLK